MTLPRPRGSTTGRWPSPSLWTFAPADAREAGRVGGVGTGGAALSGGVGGPDRRGDGHRGGLAGGGEPSDDPCLAAPLWERGDRLSGQPVVPAASLPAPDPGRARGDHCDDAPGPSGLGAETDPDRAGPGQGRAAPGPIDDLSHPGPQRADRSPAASATAGGLSPLGTVPVHGAVADGCHEPGPADRRDRAVGGDGDR